MRVAKKKVDWRIKDKMYIIVNLINRRIILSNLDAHTISFKEVLKKTTLLSKKNKTPLIEVLTNIINYLHDNPDSITIRESFEKLSINNQK